MCGKSEVSIGKCNSYDADELRRSLETCLAPIGGLRSFVESGDRVLLKPNFVSAKPIAQACNTHPEFIFTVCRMIKDLGAVPVIGESPALGSSMAAAGKMGMKSTLEKEGIQIIDFIQSKKVRCSNGQCNLRIAKEIDQYDKILNLPKLKSHGQMRMSCCVKNLFGFVVGRHKAGLHMTIGHNENWFSSMILDVAERVKPTLNLVDGVVALEKGGPIHGSPINLKLIAAGQNPVAVDTAIYDWLNIAPMDVPVQVEAMRQELPGSKLEDLILNSGKLRKEMFPVFEPKEHLKNISFSPLHIFKGYIKQFKRRMTKQ